MFGKTDSHKKKKSGGGFLSFLFVRLPLTLIMLGFLVFAGYKAYVHFSGTDPVTMDPQTALLSIVTSEHSANLITSLLSLNFNTSLSEFKEVLKIGTTDESSDISTPTSSPKTTTPSGTIVMKVAVVADSHTDNQSLQKAIAQVKKEGVKAIIGLGDYSNVGTSDELQKSQAIFEASGIPIYPVAGDHDLWDCRNRGEDPLCNFRSIFGQSYQSFKIGDVRFVMIHNSDNYIGIDGVQMRWLQDEFTRIQSEKNKAIFVFAHEPFYHPSSDHFMGKESPKLRDQAKDVIQMMRQAKVAEVFYGDTHFFGRYTDPVSELRMTTVGAVTSERNTQKPRFVIVDVYESGEYNVRDIEVQ
jgi:predicted phosphodiesterase